MKYLNILFLLFAFACSNTDQQSDEHSQDANESSATIVEEIVEGVFFGNIEDGDTLASPFLMKMEVKGMTVEPKGEVREGYGHHHLLVNDTYFDQGMFIAADSTHIHYGGGQIEDSVSLAPGEYVLTLQFADGMHMSYGEDWSSTISVVVQ